MQTRIRMGQRLPAVNLAELVRGNIIEVPVEPLLAGRRSLIIGVPGAFTPTCSQMHLPDFIIMADRFRASGFDQLLVVATSDPFSNDVWQRQLDPGRKLRFLSDGNLELARAMGLAGRSPEFFIGERSARYTMIVQDAVVERLNVEASVANVTCTRADAIELAA